MSIRLIPRVRVNYSFADLFKATFVSEIEQTARLKCEKIISTYFEGEYVCLTPSGRDAIYELLIRLPQRRVLVPAYTCMAVVEAVLLSKKEIVFCETNARSFNSYYVDQIDSDCIVLATHQYGLPCNIEEISVKCKEVGAVIIEDCATSIGTTVNGKKAGTFGSYAIVSFNSSKLVNVPPSGGAIISKDRVMIDNIKNQADWKPSDAAFKCKTIIMGLVYVLTKNVFAYKLFHYLMIDSKGKLQRTNHEKPAEQKTELYSYQFAEWQAVFLLRQLEQLEILFSQRKDLFEHYNNAIVNPSVKKPILDRNAVCCRYSIQVEDRKAFYKECVKRGVDMDFSHCNLGCPESFCTEHKIANDILNLPFYYNLSEKEIETVVDVVNSIE